MSQLSNYKKWTGAIEKFKEPDYEVWFKFAMLWFSFNAYYSERYSHISEEKLDDRYFGKNNLIKFKEKEYGNIIVSYYLPKQKT